MTSVFGREPRKSSACVLTPFAPCSAANPSVPPPSTFTAAAPPSAAFAFASSSLSFFSCSGLATVMLVPKVPPYRPCSVMSAKNASSR